MVAQLALFHGVGISSTVQVDEEDQEEVLQTEMVEPGLLALRELENANGLQITIPATAQKSTLPSHHTHKRICNSI